jgi:transcriptional regulator with XRE-family HTH domain
MTGNHRVDGDSTATNIFGGALKRHRQRLAWSQEDLAEASRVAARTISDLERGVAQQPRSATIRMLAEALGLSGADLAAFRVAARAGRETGQAGDQGDQPTAMPAAAVRPVPPMLPRDIESFTGRQDGPDRLMAAAPSSPGGGGAVRVFAIVIGIYAVGEMGGIGDTALALRAPHPAAHPAAHQLPKGRRTGAVVAASRRCRRS